VFNSGKVLGSAISLVVLESILRKVLCMFDHDAVAGHFCNDGCGRNTGFLLIPIDNGTVGIIKPHLVAAIDQEVGGL